MATREQRSTSWNVEIFVGSKPIAGVYQSGDLLRVADMAYELELCLIFDKPDAAAPLQSALLQRGTTNHSLIILDHQDERPFPTPTPLGESTYYDYVFHSSQCARDLHSLTDPCIQRPGKTKRRDDPCYLEIGKQS
ncbi:hypothetical protein VM1G_06474 [Cytospora mali]|uniref:Uncharacterized protein n=1 Tax=Cytospora mali TaxID=578113 RepID=A0A194W325_CYTMA|nr:hypothetical protein VM1G_06474 [Valsa mali]